MSEVGKWESGKVTKKIQSPPKIIAEIFAQFNYFSYLCIIDARPIKASKICEQAREYFFVGLPEKISWLTPQNID